MAKTKKNKTDKKDKKDKLGRSMETVEKKKAENKAKLLTELESSFGIVTTALKKCKISHAVYYVWLKEDEVFAKAVEEVQDTFDILVEDKLKEGILNNDGGHIRFYLSHKVAKYKPKVEMSPMEGNNFSIEITTTKAKKNGSDKS